jgi:hypothetical protein
VCIGVSTKPRFLLRLNHTGGVWLDKHLSRSDYCLKELTIAQFTFVASDVQFYVINTNVTYHMI